MKIFFLIFVWTFLSLACGTHSDTVVSSNETVPLFETQALQIQTTSTTLNLTVEAADTKAKQEYGLMNRVSLDSDKGMLFVFDAEAEHSFWMKDTYISLDMIFINAAKKIVYIQENTTPLSEEPIAPSDLNQYVLEVNGGYSAEHGVNVGDILVF